MCGRGTELYGLEYKQRKNKAEGGGKYLKIGNK